MRALARPRAHVARTGARGPPRRAREHGLRGREEAKGGDAARARHSPGDCSCGGLARDGSERTRRGDRHSASSCPSARRAGGSVGGGAWGAMGKGANNVLSMAAIVVGEGLSPQGGGHANKSGAAAVLSGNANGRQTAPGSGRVMMGPLEGGRRMGKTTGNGYDKALRTTAGSTQACAEGQGPASSGAAAGMPWCFGVTQQPAHKDEDRWAAAEVLAGVPGLEGLARHAHAAYAVYDGHNGPSASTLATKELLHRISAAIDRKEAELQIPPPGASKTSDTYAVETKLDTREAWSPLLLECVSTAFVELDKHVCSTMHGGTTATLIFLKYCPAGKTVDVLSAWVGDSRAAMLTWGGPETGGATEAARVRDLTTDHKPGTPAEQMRLRNSVKERYGVTPSFDRASPRRSPGHDGVLVVPRQDVDKLSQISSTLQGGDAAEIESRGGINDTDAYSRALRMQASEGSIRGGMAGAMALLHARRSSANSPEEESASDVSELPAVPFVAKMSTHCGYTSAARFIRPDGASMGVSRTIGDRGWGCGVIADPEFSQAKVHVGEMARIVLASDGLWDCVSSRLALGGVDGSKAPAAKLGARINHGKPERVSASLIGTAVEKRVYSGHPRDDITIMFVDIDPAGPARQGGEKVAGASAPGGDAPECSCAIS